MPDDHANVAFFPPLGFAAVLVAIIALDWLLPLRVPDAAASVLRGVGLALCVIAAVLAVSAIFAFRRAGTYVEPHKPTLKIVTDGVYRFSRNPMYIGLVAFFLGLGLSFGNLWVLPGTAILWFALDRGVVAREERYLERKFGDEYRALLARTRRWL